MSTSTPVRRIASRFDGATSTGEFLPLLTAVNRMQAEADQAAAAKGRRAGKVTLRFLGATVSSVITGPNSGCLYIKSQCGSYFGKVDAAGTFRRAPGLACSETAVVEALRKAQADPEAAAVAYGRETGSCCCCGRGLTNQVSIDLGIGPICLEKLGGAF
jgi:hypothetical protein